jgi:hypothetical protein
MQYKHFLKRDSAFSYLWPLINTMYKNKKIFFIILFNELSNLLIIYRVYKKPEFGRFFHVFRPEIFFKNDPIRANFMRGIAHIFEAWKHFLDPESGNRSVCIEAKIENF